MKLFNLGNGLYRVKTGVFLPKFGHSLLLIYLLSLIMCERAGKKLLGRYALCIKVTSDPVTFFNKDAYVLDFCTQNYPLIFSNFKSFLAFINKSRILGFQIMKNNTKKASVKVWEGLLYFQHFMQIFSLP